MALALRGVEAPLRPIAVWTANPFEVRIAFGRNLEVPSGRNWRGIRIEFSETNFSTPTLAGPLSADDPTRFPPAQLRVVAARLDADRRTVVVATDPHPVKEFYRLTLPGVRAAGSKVAPTELRLRYDLTGVEATWGPKEGTPTWAGWLPNLDIGLSLRSLAGSAEEQQILKFLKRPGQLTLKTLVEVPQFAGVLRLESEAPFQVSLDDRAVQPEHRGIGPSIARMAIEPDGSLHAITVALATGLKHQAPDLRLSVDASRKPSTPNGLRWWVPWAPSPRPTPGPPPKAPDLAGGDYPSGQALFEGSQLKCASCHRLRGQGGLIAPDLTEQYRRNPAEVLDDIVNPSKRLNPDYVCFNVTLREGVDVTAFAHLKQGNQVELIESDGKTNVVKRSDILAIRPSALSLMPTGMLDTLAPRQVRDLLTFLLSPPSR